VSIAAEPALDASSPTLALPFSSIRRCVAISDHTLYPTGCSRCSTAGVMCLDIEAHFSALAKG
jgi:hypothetical protein